MEMNELLQGFKDEALQLIEKLDGILIELEKRPPCDDDVQELFRIMHTVKGSAAMFNYTKASALAHKLEDVYDLVRDSKIELSSEIISLTFKGSDLIKELLKNNDLLSTEEDLTELNNDIQKFLPNEESENSLEQAGLNQVDRTNIGIYYIKFTPDSDALIRGLAVPSAFEELSEIGEITGIPILTKIPSPEDFDPNTFYVSWDLFMKTDASVEDIEDVFLFYNENEFLILPLSNTDLSKDKAFTENCLGIAMGETSLTDLQVRLNNLLEKNESSTVDLTGDNNPTEAQSQPEKESRVQKEKSVQTIKVDTLKLDELINLVSELVTLNSRLEVSAGKIEDDELKKTVMAVSKLSKRFRDNALDMRLIQIKVLELKMQRLIRDLSKQLNKEVDFLVDGTNTELDKNIIARIEGPIMHLLRNSVDHGLESTEERIKADKPSKGVIKFISFYSGSNVFIQIQDDGKGIDPRKIQQKAIEKGLIKKDDHLEKHEIFDLLFTPGFSTASSVTNVSGRGVGLDVVKNEIMSMRGEIDIESEIGLGTSFTLKLPLTLSIIDSLLTTVDNTPILIPREFIEQTNISKKKHAFEENIDFEGKLIPAISMHEELGYSPHGEGKKYYQVIVNQNGKQYALMVDKIYGEHQVVVKPLGHYINDHDYFSSASIMGDGNLAFILDVAKLINNKKGKNKLGNYNLK